MKEIFTAKFKLTKATFVGKIKLKVVAEKLADQIVYKITKYDLSIRLLKDNSLIDFDIAKKEGFILDLNFTDPRAISDENV